MSPLSNNSRIPSALFRAEGNLWKGIYTDLSNSSDVEVINSRRNSSNSTSTARSDVLVGKNLVTELHLVKAGGLVDPVKELASLVIDDTSWNRESIHGNLELLEGDLSTGYVVECSRICCSRLNRCKDISLLNIQCRIVSNNKQIMEDFVLVALLGHEIVTSSRSSILKAATQQSIIALNLSTRILNTTEEDLVSLGDNRTRTLKVVEREVRTTLLTNTSNDVQLVDTVSKRIRIRSNIFNTLCTTEVIFHDVTVVVDKVLVVLISSRELIKESRNLQANKERITRLKQIVLSQVCKVCNTAHKCELSNITRGYSVIKYIGYVFSSHY
nr:MAG TPA: hypothetical protein [Caudoviricetes sp.]